MVCQNCDKGAEVEPSTQVCKDCGEKLRAIEFEGLTIVLYRSKLDGALSIDIDSANLAKNDVQVGGHDIPRIRLTINSHTEQLDALGNWTPEAAYPHPTVLDRIVDATS